MGSLYTPSQPYSLTEYLENLPAYTLNAGVDQLLDLARQIEDSQSYYWQPTCFPSSQDAELPPLGTFSGVITVPSLAYVVAITASSIIAADTPGPGTPGADSLLGFKARIYDKGGKIDTFINSTFARKFGVFTNLEVEPNTSTPPTQGPYFLQTPMVVIEPGALQLEITNLEPADSVIAQIVLHLAVP